MQIRQMMERNASGMFILYQEFLAENQENDTLKSQLSILIFHDPTP